VPKLETHCAWQIMLTTERHPANAVLHANTRGLLGVHLVTFENLLWGDSLLSSPS